MNKVALISFMWVTSMKVQMLSDRKNYHIRIWDRDLIHNLQQCKFTMEDRQQGTFRGSGIDTMGALNDVKIVLH